MKETGSWGIYSRILEAIELGMKNNNYPNILSCLEEEDVSNQGKAFTHLLDKVEGLRGPSMLLLFEDDNMNYDPANQMMGIYPNEQISFYWRVFTPRQTSPEECSKLYDICKATISNLGYPVYGGSHARLVRNNLYMGQIKFIYKTAYEGGQYGDDVR